MAGNLLTHKWFILIGIAVLLFNTINGVVTGEVSMFYKTYRKSERPISYWLSLVLSGVATLAGVWMLFM